jgi:malate dehydrogenase (oxaloacetate-decarboxylating)(NADP+)
MMYLFVQNRPKGGISTEKAPFAQDHAPVDSLEEAVNIIKPSCIVG